MIDRVLRLADKSVRSIMVPRPDVIWLDVEYPDGAILDEVRDSGHSRFPVARRDVADTIAVVHANDLLDQHRHAAAIHISRVMRQPHYFNHPIPTMNLPHPFPPATLPHATIH